MRFSFAAINLHGWKNLDSPLAGVFATYFYDICNCELLIAVMLKVLRWCFIPPILDTLGNSLYQCSCRPSCP
jgi:hypothetical protein